MRLNKIQVSGFKSFVDPTPIKFPANIIGIVGPNGCGKSNVIDAVRWVMGESSARNLRGDSMMDVIFNGSSARKPVSKASVELLFDNDKGKLPDAYAQFAEISIKRELTRAGQSDYFINNIRCRRRDITDIFRGTGLGTRSYSIIEQGMVSRIIEAKPEDLRAFVEEASGISKYKDRRRETETRIRHSRENLSRVEDIRNELDTQLRRLQRQSQAAKRYKKLKQEERIVQAQIMGLRWQSLKLRAAEHEQKLDSLETVLEAKLAEQRMAERGLEDLRVRQNEQQQSVSKAQADFYQAGAEVSNLEQRIEHERSSHQQRKLELQRLEVAHEQMCQQIAVDKSRRRQIQQQLESLLPEISECDDGLDKAVTELNDVERAFAQWQATWDAFGKESAEPQTQQSVHGARLQQLETHLEQLNARRHKLKIEHEQSSTNAQHLASSRLREEVAAIDSDYEQATAAVSKLAEDIRVLRIDLDASKATMDASSAKLNTAQTRHTSLKEIQASALGEDDGEFAEWLNRTGLENASRLTDLIRVESGWERAVDAVLAHRSGAVSVDSLDGFANAFDHAPEASLTLIDAQTVQQSENRPNTLLAKISSDRIELTGLLTGVLTADSTQQAIDNRAQLGLAEYFVCENGVMIGRNWMTSPARNIAGEGLLARREELARLGDQITVLGRKVDAEQEAYLQNTKQLMSLEGLRDDKQLDVSNLAQTRTERHNRLGREETQAAQLKQRMAQLELELEEIESQRSKDKSETELTERLLAAATERTGTVEQQRVALLQERDELRGRLSTSRQQVEQAREARHQTVLKGERIRAEIDSVDAALRRLTQQTETESQRISELKNQVDEQSPAEQSLQQSLQVLLDKRSEFEHALVGARESLNTSENQLQSETGRRNEFEQAVTGARERLDAGRMVKQELSVRQQTLDEQLTEEGHEVEQIIQEMPEEAKEGAWAERLDGLANRISRIGPVNLVAIEEFEEQSERKTYLDQQYADLVEALETLESVIRKIDRETRERFKETFDALNTAFQALFPKLFGGGSATLSLTDDDLLNTGITVMARPPGKRNSTIHLLSGGEKALTAVSLLFAFFQLNPAPFCILDEVDAPLDDANVERYCKTLKSLSEHTQLIFITHNKITMESADILVGVTMAEPGVSRLVSVDIEEAVKLSA